MNNRTNNLTEPTSVQAIQLTQALTQLSDAGWLQLKRVEDQRRADQHDIRNLAKELRALRRKRTRAA